MSPRRANPMLAVDVVVVRCDGPDLRFGVAERIFEPHLGELALPGVLMIAGERVADAAHRAVVTKLGIEGDAIRNITVGQVYDTPERDERGPTVSIGCIAVVDPDRVESDFDCRATWVGFDEAPTLPFDHDRIVSCSRRWLAELIWSDPAVLRALVGDTFDTAQMGLLETNLAGRARRLANVHRQLDGLSFIERDGQAVVTGRGRPKTAWRVCTAH